MNEFCAHSADIDETAHTGVIRSDLCFLPFDICIVGHVTLWFGFQLNSRFITAKFSGTFCKFGNVCENLILANICKFVA